MTFITCSILTPDIFCSEVGVDIVLYTLDLITKLRICQPELTATLHKHLQVIDY